jgi:hypothetical protein
MHGAGIYRLVPAKQKLVHDKNTSDIFCSGIGSEREWRKEKENEKKNGRLMALLPSSFFLLPFDSENRKVDTTRDGGPGAGGDGDGDDAEKDELNKDHRTPWPWTIGGPWHVCTHAESQIETTQAVA